MSRVAVLGAGPAGFYAAQALVRRGALVDILESLPVPFGLVRYGVAPDHPATKAAGNTFSKFMNAHSRSVRFFGNVPALGASLPLEVLREHYASVVLATGPLRPRIPPFSSKSLRVESAHDFMLWANGHPAYHNTRPGMEDLLGGTSDVLVLGAGNVALDVARLLLRDVNDLAGTDISPRVLSVLAERPDARTVSVAVRRGPKDAAWSTAALRELCAKIEGVQVRCNVGRVLQDSELDSGGEHGIRPEVRRRLKMLLKNSSDLTRSLTPPARALDLMFEREVETVHDTPGGVKVGFGLRGTSRKLAESRGADAAESAEYDFVFTSLGYEAGARVPGAASVGWANGAARGIIGDNKWDAEGVVAGLTDAECGIAPAGARRVGIAGVLADLGVRAVDWHGWERVDAEERRRGKQLHPSRERLKFETVAELLHAAGC